MRLLWKTSNLARSSSWYCTVARVDRWTTMNGTVKKKTVNDSATEGIVSAEGWATRTTHTQIGMMWSQSGDCNTSSTKDRPTLGQWKWPQQCLQPRDEKSSDVISTRWKSQSTTAASSVGWGCLLSREPKTNKHERKHYFIPSFEKRYRFRLVAM